MARHLRSGNIYLGLLFALAQMKIGEEGDLKLIVFLFFQGEVVVCGVS